MYDIQKASLLKRISAFLLDFILMTIAVTGFALLLSTVLGYDNYAGALTEKREYYEATYEVDFDIKKEDYDALSEEDRKVIDDAYAIYMKDTDVIFNYNMLFNLMLIIASMSLVLSFLLLEFVVPLLLKNGQTVGKKIFAIGVVHLNSVRITSVALFARSILGKCVLELMVPLIVIATMLFGSGGPVGLLVLGLILLLELFCFFKEGKFTLIHDVLSHTVAVDLATQMIFDTPDDMIAYKTRIHAEDAASQSY